jgi:membrane protein implicated in regulation of membrane protease activity
MIFEEISVRRVIVVYYLATAVGFLIYRSLWRRRWQAASSNPSRPVDDNLWLIFVIGLNPFFGALLFPLFWPLVLALHLILRWLPDGMLAENFRENSDTVIDPDHRSGLEKRVGEIGRAVSDLRPAGRVEVGGEIVEASSEGGFIGKDEPIIVIGTDGYRLRVKERPDPAGDEAGSTQ